MTYKVGWLVGASGGIGNAFAQNLAEKCEKVLLIDRSEASSKFLLNSNQSNFKCFTFDAADEIIFSEFSNSSTCLYGSPDVLVISAGTVYNSSFENTDISIVDSLYRNNFRMLTIAIQNFYQCCSHNPNHPKFIVVVSSNAGIIARPNQPIYAAFKAGINSLVKSLAVSWGHLNIRVNAIAPGTVLVDRNTEYLKKIFPSLPKDPNRPLGRIALPEDLNEVLSMLISPCSLITGQVIVVDGGSSLTRG